jgi:hypothetical protein
MRRMLLALPTAAILSLAVAGSAFATHCGNASKQADAGQHAVIFVGATGVTPIAGFNAAGRFTGGFVDVYIDLDGSGTINTGDLKINDTFILSEHSGGASPGQIEDGLAVLPAIMHDSDPAGAARGAGFADVSFVP